MLRAVLVAAATLIASPALAQTQTTLVTQFQPVALDTRGTPSPFLPGTLTAPLRLTLQNAIVPMGGAFAECATHDEPSGNSVGGIPLAFQREVRITPALTLSGFSRLGCPIDATLGAIAALTLPISNSLSFVLGAGIIIAPGQIPLVGNVQNAISRNAMGATSPLYTAAHADLVWKTSGGRTFSVGVGNVGRGRGVSFGGGF